MRWNRSAVALRDGPVNPLKVRLGMPRELAFCHEALVAGYVVEGTCRLGEKRLWAYVRPFRACRPVRENQGRS